METLLWKFRQKGCLIDKPVFEIVDKIDNDFGEFADIRAISRMGWIIRSLLTDSMIKQFIALP